MPPIVAQKRLRSDPPPTEPPAKRSKARKVPASRNQDTVFQTLDTPPIVKHTLSQAKAALENDDEHSETSDSDSSDDDFEDVPLNGTSNTKETRIVHTSTQDDNSDNENWENALSLDQSIKTDHGPAPIISGDIALTLSAAPKAAFGSQPDGRKGPSKVQRHIRNVTHCMHVQYLMFHNLIRNAWIQDKEVQGILVNGLSTSCWREVDRYWKDAGIINGKSCIVSTAKMPPLEKKATLTKKGKWNKTETKDVQVYESSQAKRAPARGTMLKEVNGKAKEGECQERPGRDWGATSEPLEPNVPNLSAGDPLIRLMRCLSAFWKSKFNVTKPSLHKRGYLSPSTLEAEINSFREDPSHLEFFGERVESRDKFKDLARSCEGSRDVGEQLFTALVRGLGIEARMVVSLQPVGFGWSQNEEGKGMNLEELNDEATKNTTIPPMRANSSRTQKKVTSNARFKKAVDDGNMSDSSDLSSVISISSDSEVERPTKKSSKTRKASEDLPYPTYWTEVISHLNHTPVSVSTIPRTLIVGPTSADKLVDFYARGAAADKAKQVFAYLIAFSSDGTAKDVTTRYLPKRRWPGRTSGFRIRIERIPIHNQRGKVKRWEEWDWFNTLMRSYARPHEDRQPWDEVEDEGDLIPADPKTKPSMNQEGGKETLQGYKNSTEYVLERHLRREEALKPGSNTVRHFVTGKGDNEKSEPVYRRTDIVACKSAESWHKEGREIITGQQPLKCVPMRVVTVARKREMEERERQEGAKVLQGLYSKAQTEWIIPDPIVDGKIPRNAFDNIDIYVKTMVPKGAVHIPLKGTARICKKLEIDYAEACTGFEFGKQRAVPVITGVVVAEENEELVLTAWEAEEVEKARKEADKRQKLILGWWKKFMSGLRVVERMRLEYGEEDVLPTKAQPLIQTKTAKKSEMEAFKNQEDFEGGFLRDEAQTPSYEAQSKPLPDGNVDDNMVEGFFPMSQEESVHNDLTIDHDERQEKENVDLLDKAYRTPISLAAAMQQPDEEASDQDATALSVGGSINHQSQDTDHEPPPQFVSRPKSNVAKPSRGGGRQRGNKVPSTNTFKRKPGESIPAEQEESPLAGGPPTALPTRATPQRKAARTSESQFKSHFFAGGSDGETDLTDLTEQNSPKMKAVRRKNGKGRGRGKA